MNLTREAIDLSYQACHRLARRSGSNFYPCFLGLSRDKRRAMDALYAFMRHTDDLADDPLPAELRRQSLDKWRNALRQALRGQFTPSPRRAATNGQAANSDYPCGPELLPALADVVQRYGVPPEHLQAVIDGVGMDLSRLRYETFDELAGYCERVASAVGLACIHIWGFRGREALEPARKCGIALQLTNILRDLKEDSAQDRVYLPLADLQQCGYSLDDLFRGVADERFVRLMEFEIGRAEWFYGEGAELIDHLEPDGRQVFGMMVSTYRALLRKIKRHPADVLQRRVRLSRPKKLQIAARWILWPPRVAALS
ncbi:MAG: squalene/phytoene synthase family protein [Pirellulales bacterium]|nr:squalene/phytoene synthase family protein [Pirellulales bacterium]